VRPASVWPSALVLDGGRLLRTQRWPRVSIDPSNPPASDDARLTSLLHPQQRAGFRLVWQVTSLESPAFRNLLTPTPHMTLAGQRIRSIPGWDVCSHGPPDRCFWMTSIRRDEKPGRSFVLKYEVLSSRIDIAQFSFWQEASLWPHRAGQRQLRPSGSTPVVALLNSRCLRIGRPIAKELMPLVSVDLETVG
jgi:hypothetical protein